PPTTERSPLSLHDALPICATAGATSATRARAVALREVLLVAPTALRRPLRRPLRALRRPLRALIQSATGVLRVALRVGSVAVGVAVGALRAGWGVVMVSNLLERFSQPWKLSRTGSTNRSSRSAACLRWSPSTSRCQIPDGPGGPGRS